MAEKENNPGKPPVPESSLKSKRKITSSASASNLSFFLRERSSSGDLVEAAAAAAARAKRRVCVLLTGGTMAMRARKDGTLAPSPGYLAAQMRAMPELREARMPECVSRVSRAARSSLSRSRARALTRACRAGTT